MKENQFDSEVQERIGQLSQMATLLGISVEEAKRAIANFANAMRIVVDTAVEELEQMWGEITEILKVVEYEEVDRKWKRELHKLDFTRPKIKHQVMCRKPRNLVKKIIR